MRDSETGWKMSRRNEISLNHVWKMKGWRQPNPETHEKNRRKEHSPPRSFCIFVTSLRGGRIHGHEQNQEAARLTLRSLGLSSVGAAGIPRVN